MLDLEYAVSRNSAFKYNGDKKKVVPRFDIIAIGNGQIVVIELKKGLGATEGVSGIGPHIDCYDHTIGRDNGGEFVKEMRELLAQKQEFGLLDSKLKITKERPKFIFAFSDEDGKDEFGKFLDRLPEAYKASAIYLDKNHKLVSKKESSMNTAFSEQERKHHLALLADPQKHEELFENAEGGGCWWNRDEQKWDHYPHILKHENSVCNLYGPIRRRALDYFERHDIAWWRVDTDRYFPTGHLVSSQIHCLNHLFAFRDDPIAIKIILQKATNLPIDKILQSPIDKGGYIAFEFVYKNKSLLKDNSGKYHEKYETRGANCTSIDALVYVQLVNGNKILIPIEWKYTETYNGKEACDKSWQRYPDLIRLENSNLKDVYDLYKADPYYELMRQTLLMEQIIQHKDCGIEADDYFHIMVIPNEHTELKSAIVNNYIPTLKDITKFRIIDPQELLSPIPADGDYKDLISYLQTRYWKK